MPEVMHLHGPSVPRLRLPLPLPWHPLGLSVPLHSSSRQPDEVRPPEKMLRHGSRHGNAKTSPIASNEARPHLRLAPRPIEPPPHRPLMRGCGDQVIYIT